MNIYTYAMDHLLNLPPIDAWPEMQDILRRSVSDEPRSWGLPLVVCEAVGGAQDQAIAAVAAIGCLQISIILIDDMLDVDPRGEHHQIGMPAAANLAAGFQAAGLQVIAHAEIEPTVKLSIMRSLNQMVLTTAFGQHMDAQNPTDEPSYWQLVQTKSSPFYGTALHIGALLGGASTETAAQIKRFGELSGEMIQIHDDLNDTMAVPANPDWIQGRSPLPILFAEIVEHPDRARFIELRRTIPDPDALAEAQAILIRCGAVSYCMDQLFYRHQLAQDILISIPLTHRAGMDVLLEELLRPVWELLKAIGVVEPEALERTAWESMAT